MSREEKAKSQTEKKVEKECSDFMKYENILAVKSFIYSFFFRQEFSMSFYLTFHFFFPTLCRIFWQKMKTFRKIYIKIFSQRERRMLEKYLFTGNCWKSHHHNAYLTIPKKGYEFPVNLFSTFCICYCTA